MTDEELAQLKAIYEREKTEGYEEPKTGKLLAEVERLRAEIERWKDAAVPELRRVMEENDRAGAVAQCPGSSRAGVWCSPCDLAANAAGLVAS